MSIFSFYDMGHITSILNSWWLLMTWIIGFWSILLINPALLNKGLEKEAQWAFFGGWFWLGSGLFGFVGARIFDYFF